MTAARHVGRVATCSPLSGLTFSAMEQFKENINLSGITNYRIGGPATFFFEAKSPKEVLWAVNAAKERKTDFFVLGAGTNILAPDEGFAGLVLRPKIDFIEIDGDFLRAGAGALVSDVLQAAAKAGLSGLEWAGGLPGTFGGAIRGNAGAFKGEIKDVVHDVESFNTKTFAFITRTNAECAFSYRSSIFKEKGDEIILSARLLLAKGDPKKIAKAIAEKIAYRMNRHPMEYPNVGSIFKNVPLARIYAEGTPNYADAVRNSLLHFRGSSVPVKIDPFPVVPTAYLISESGLKGVSFGGAMVSPKHPNFIVNVLDAKASDIKTLISLVKTGVAEKFAVDLEEEVHIL